MFERIEVTSGGICMAEIDAPVSINILLQIVYYKQSCLTTIELLEL